MRNEDGVLFVEYHDCGAAFHMEGVQTALVIAWFDANGDHVDHRIMPKKTG